MEYVDNGIVYKQAAQPSLFKISLIQYKYATLPAPKHLPAIRFPPPRSNGVKLSFSASHKRSTITPKHLKLGFLFFFHALFAGKKKSPQLLYKLWLCPQSQVNSFSTEYQTGVITGECG